MKCDIIIPIWNQLETTRECLESIVRNTRCPYRLILIDNASRGDTKSYLEAFSRDLAAQGKAEALVIRNSENLGFVKAVNQGLAASSAPYVCVMNNDTIAAPGWLENMIGFAERHPDAGLLNPQCDGHGDRSIDEHAALLARDKDAYMEMNQCFGYCMLIRREVIQKIGYLDEAYGMGNYDDTDYSMRAGLAGYRSVNVHSAYVYHKKHVSFKAAGNRDALVSEGAKEYFRKWPRHLRIGLSLAIDKTTPDAAIASALRSILFLAREWCWVNVWIFGDKGASRKRIEEVARSIEMPLHQNLKFTYASSDLGGMYALAKLLERSFGTKSRKRYDAFISDREAPLAKALYPVHKTAVCTVDFLKDGKRELEMAVADARKRPSTCRS